MDEKQKWTNLFIKYKKQCFRNSGKWIRISQIFFPERIINKKPAVPRGYHCIYNQFCWNLQPDYQEYILFNSWHKSLPTKIVSVPSLKSDLYWSFNLIFYIFFAFKFSLTLFDFPPLYTLGEKTDPKKHVSAISYWWLHADNSKNVLCTHKKWKDILIPIMEEGLEKTTELTEVAKLTV